jgi:hypothetical protein
MHILNDQLKVLVHILDKVFATKKLVNIQKKYVFLFSSFYLTSMFNDSQMHVRLAKFHTCHRRSDLRISVSPKVALAKLPPIRKFKKVTHCMDGRKLQLFVLFFGSSPYSRKRKYGHNIKCLPSFRLGLVGRSVRPSVCPSL